MRTYAFNHSTPLYDQLYRFLKADIEQKQLTAGEKLPSKRQFAKHLGVSVMTIETAYQQLIAEGYIYALPKKGFFVNHLTLPEKMPTRSDSFQTSCPEYEEKCKKPLADLTNSQTAAEAFPFSVWSKLVREVLRHKQTELMTRSDIGGVLPLRQAIAEHLAAFRGMRVKPAQIIIGAGAEYLHSLLIQLFGQDKTYVFSDPGYHKLRLIYQSQNARTLSVSTDYPCDTLTAAGAQIVHTSPSHHFPTGVVMSAAKRYELLAWAAEQSGRYIIEDDYDSEFRFVGQPIPTLQSIDMLGRVIYMNTFSKTLASTVRIAYMVLPLPLLDLFRQKLGFYASTVSHFEQYVLAEFIRQGYFEKHLNRMRTLYRQKRDRLLNALRQSRLADRITITEEHAGLHFIVRFETAKSGREIAELAETAGVRLKRLAEYYTTPKAAEDKDFVIAYSNLTDEMIETAVSALETAVLD